MVNEALFRSAAQVAEMVRRKEISSGELTEALFARIEAVNPAVNAVVELRRGRRCRKRPPPTQRSALAPPGPLHGVPMTVKDSFNVAALHTTWGNPEF